MPEGAGAAAEVGGSARLSLVRAKPEAAPAPIGPLPGPMLEYITSDEALSTVGVGESSSSVDTNVSWPESPPPPIPEVLTEGGISVDTAVQSSRQPKNIRSLEVLSLIQEVATESMRAYIPVVAEEAAAESDPGGGMGRGGCDIFPVTENISPSRRPQHLK